MPTKSERIGQSKARGRARKQLSKFTAKHIQAPVSTGLNPASRLLDLRDIQVPMWVVTETESLVGVVQIVDQEYVLQLTCCKAGQAIEVSWQVRLEAQRLAPAQVLEYGLYLTQLYLVTHPAEQGRFNSQTVLSAILLVFDTL